MDSSSSDTYPRAGSHSDTDLAIGQIVGEYKVEEKIGEGGFGNVFRAIHPVIGKVAAIKVLHRRYSAQPEMVSRFIAEARAVNQIRHRNIIDIFSFGELEDGRNYYVMEYLEGMTLEDYLEHNGPMSLFEAIPVLRRLARALDAAHAKGIAHRDLKPDNVFMVPDEDGGYAPKLLDFGIAKLFAEELPQHKHKTRTGAPIGTPQYMSPEQCRGRGVDHRTDIYGFGVMTYRLLTGVLPFDGEDYMDVLMAQINDDALPPSSVAPHLSDAVDESIDWMLQKDPAERPPNLFTAMRSLEAAAESIGVSVPRPPSLVGIPVMSAKASMGPTMVAAGHVDGAAGDDMPVILVPDPGRVGTEGGGRARSHAGPSARAGSHAGPVARAGSHAGSRRRAASVRDTSVDGPDGSYSVSSVSEIAWPAVADDQPPAVMRDSESVTAEVRADMHRAQRRVGGPRWLTKALLVAVGLASALIAAIGANWLLSPALSSAPDDGVIEINVEPRDPEPRPTSAAAAGVASAATSASADDEGRYVTVTIVGPPAGTEVYGPAGLLGVAPGKIQLVRGDEPVLITLKAGDLRPQTREVLPTDDRELRVEFAEPEPAPAQPTSAGDPEPGDSSRGRADRRSRRSDQRSGQRSEQRSGQSSGKPSGKPSGPTREKRDTIEDPFK